MNDIKENISLKNFNTFGLDVVAAGFAAFDSIERLREILINYKNANMPLLVLGGGSNVLFTTDFPGLILKNNIPGIEVIESDNEQVLVKAGGGVVWHDLVMYCVNANYGGIENLSLIPGCVGAAPIQNIGAYGVELKDSFETLEAMEIATGKMVHFNREQCRFGYRDSIFKREGKGKYIITSVTLWLNKQPELKLSYGAIKQELEKMGVAEPTVKSVSLAVCNIRRSKLPDPAILGNAGSFFKNPEVSGQFYYSLKALHPEVVGYPVADGNYKLAAGWLIEQCGWKGKRVGNTGSHKDQALVLVNYGNATGKEVINLAMEIRKSVLEKFGVTIEPEVNVI